MIPPFLSLSFHDVEEGKFSLSFHICVLSLNVFSSDIHSLFTQILVCLFTTEEQVIDTVGRYYAVEASRSFVVLGVSSKTRVHQCEAMAKCENKESMFHISFGASIQRSAE